MDTVEEQTIKDERLKMVGLALKVCDVVPVNSVQAAKDAVSWVPNSKKPVAIVTDTADACRYLRNSLVGKNKWIFYGCITEDHNVVAAIYGHKRRELDIDSFSL